MTGQEITISSGDGDFAGYLASPAGGSGPGVVVIQEIFGVNDFVRGTADRLAAEGYMALAPDLFWRLEPGIQLDPSQEAEMQRAFGLYGEFDIDKGIADIQASINALRGIDGCSGRVGASGYCLGGFLAYLTACRTDADCAVGYYGVAIEKSLGEAGQMKGALMLHIAEEDGFVPKDAQAAIHAGLGDHGKVTLHNYAGCDHAFAREGGEHYDKAAADLANSRTGAFLNSHLA